MQNAPTHLSPKPFLALEDARVAIDAAQSAIGDARLELIRIEERAANLLLSDQDARDLLAEYSVNALAKQLFIIEHGFTDWPADVTAAWSVLVRESNRIERRILALGDVMQAARERMSARVREEAQRGAAA